MNRFFAVRPGAVYSTYPGLGLGNYLYFVLRAHTERAAGHRAWVLDSGLDAHWRQALPRLAPYLLTDKAARFRRRVDIPASFLQEYGVDFSRHELEAFIAEVMLPARPGGVAQPDLVVNVRRGDYYSNSVFRSYYGFDVAAFVKEAVVAASHDRSLSWLSVVSDEPAWCRDALAWLSDHADSVTFGAQRPGPVGDFWEVSSAKSVVVTNSTFSYWAAYVSQVVHGDAHEGVWAPSLHQRNVRSGAPWQHDPRWRIIPVH